MIVKTCTSCRKKQSISEFYPRSDNRRHPYHASCKTCMRKVARDLARQQAQAKKMPACYVCQSPMPNILIGVGAGEEVYFCTEHAITYLENIEVKT